VEKVKEVVVINNEFGINAIKVVSAKDGSLLYISCNRLVGMIYDDNLSCLKVPKCEIFHLFDFNEFYGVKSL
jgi:hypothetical protein